MNDKTLSELEKREKIYSMLANKMYLPVQALNRNTLNE